MSLPKDWLDQIKSAYPKRSGGQGWGLLKKKIPSLIRQGSTFEELIEGAKRYKAFCVADGSEGSCYVKQAITFYGPGEWWMEDWDLPEAKDERDPYIVSLEKYRADNR